MLVLALSDCVLMWTSRVGVGCWLLCSDLDIMCGCWLLVTVFLSGLHVWVLAVGDCVLIWTSRVGVGCW